MNWVTNMLKKLHARNIFSSSCNFTNCTVLFCCSPCWFVILVSLSMSDLPVYLGGVLSLRWKIVRAADFSPPSYNETCLGRGGGSAPWSDRAPCRPAASVQTVKLKGERFSRWENTTWQIKRRRKGKIEWHYSVV